MHLWSPSSTPPALLLALAFLAPALALPLRPALTTIPVPAQPDPLSARRLLLPRSSEIANSTDLPLLFLRPRDFTPAYALEAGHDSGGFGLSSWAAEGERVCAAADRPKLADRGLEDEGWEGDAVVGDEDEVGVPEENETEDESIFDPHGAGEHEHAHERAVRHSTTDEDEESGAAPSSAFPSRDGQTIRHSHALTADPVAATADRQADEDTLAPAPPATDATHSFATGTSPDCPALLALFRVTSCPTWLNNTGWLPQDSPSPFPSSSPPATPSSWPCCLAHGVSCTAANPPRVVALDLARNNLTGFLSPEFLALPHLARLDVSGNALAGVLPDAFDGVPALRVLHLEDNLFTDTLPRTLLDHDKLEIVNLGNNTFSGPLEFPRAANLTVLDVAHNRLSGWLDLSANAELQTVHADFNSFTGDVPTVGPALVTLTTAHNDLTSFPASALAHATRLATLDLSANPLAGPFPHGDAPPALKSCKIDALPAGSYPSQKVMDDTASLATVCELECASASSPRQRMAKTSAGKQVKGAVALVLALATGLVMFA